MSFDAPERRGGFGLDIPQTPHAAWQVTLDRIELDVIRAERGLAQGLGQGPVRTVDQWDKPADHGPVPDELRDRAEEILARQRECMASMTALLGVNAKHQAMTDVLGQVSTRRHGLAVYVDV